MVLRTMSETVVRLLFTYEVCGLRCLAEKPDAIRFCVVVERIV